MAKTMTEQRTGPFMLLNEPLDALQNTIRMPTAHILRMPRRRWPHTSVTVPPPPTAPVKGKSVTRIANAAIGLGGLPHPPLLAIVAAKLANLHKDKADPFREESNGKRACVGRRIFMFAGGFRRHAGGRAAQRAAQAGRYPEDLPSG